MPLVDPQVSRTKFERELRQYRSLENDYIARGWWVVRAEFPEVFVVFGAPRITPPFVAFAALIDFTNYDLWPPSVKLVNPFTQIPYPLNQLPVNPTRIASTTETTTPQGGAKQVQLQLQQLAVAFSPDDVPFICLPGTREYHDNPAHSGDSWMLHRGRGEGTLYFILDQLSKYGVQPVGLQVRFGLALNANEIQP